MDHVLFFSIAVLLCVMPSVTFGQQDSGQKEGGAAGQAVKFGELEAKTAGNQDASRDINKLFWLGVGVAICVLSVPICMLIGGILSERFAPTDPIFMIPASGLFGAGIGLIVGILAPFIGLYFYAPSPPDPPLVGKPPEYVEAYTKAYRSKARGMRLTFAAAGVGGVILCGIAAWNLRGVF